MNLSPFIEHTNLKPTIVGKEVDQLVREANDHGFYGVCVPPFWVKRAHREIGTDPVVLITVVGFPLGYQMTETKMEEINLALRDGVDELDVVMDLSAFKEGMPWTKIELAKCSKLIHQHEKLMKVIIETAYLDEEEMVRAARMVNDIGADFIKTSTGFGPGGAKVEHVRLLRDALPKSVGIKASGGIKTREDAIQMIEAGAERIGTSSGVEIVADIS